MKKSFRMIAISLLMAISGTAQTINLTNTSSSVSHQWNSTNWPNAYGSGLLSQTKLNNMSPPVFIDSTPLFENEYGSSGFYINVTNSAPFNGTISYTWNAPSGMMFVVKPPPPPLGPLGLQFAASYGFPTSFNFVPYSGNLSFNVVYGTAPTNNSAGITAYYSYNGGSPTEGLDLEVGATVPANGGSFAFTSVTLTEEFDIDASIGDFYLNPSSWEPYAITLSGGNSGDAADPGPLLTLQPYSAAPPTPPALGIATYSNQPAVFFPTATGTNFLLQMTTNLASGNWVTVTSGIPISGLVITNPPANAFFRLH